MTLLSRCKLIKYFDKSLFTLLQYITLHYCSLLACCKNLRNKISQLFTKARHATTVSELKAFILSVIYATGLSREQYFVLYQFILGY